jgi:hypothetical protein
MQFLEHFDRRFCIAHDDALGQFELEAVRLDSMLSHAAGDPLDKILLPELDCRNRP